MINIENILMQVPAAIYWKDLNSVFLGCNEKFALDAGLSSPGEIINKTDFDLAWAEFADYYRQGDVQVMSGNVIENSMEIQNRPDNNYVRIINNKIALRDSKGNIIGVIGCYSDIRDPKQHGKHDKDKKNIVLTPRQVDCLVDLVLGLTARQTGDKLGISVRTVEHHIERIKHIFGCSTKADLIRKAITIDFIQNKMFA